MGGAKDRVAGVGGAGGGVMEGVQSVAHYSRLAKNAWQFLELTEEGEAEERSDEITKAL